MASNLSRHAHVLFPDALAKTAPDVADLQKAMLDATPDCIKVLSIDGNLMMMNRTGCLALGVPLDSDFGMPWLPLLPEEVRHTGEQALRTAAAGGNARFPGKSLSDEGMRYWDNLLTPLADAAGQVQSILCVSRDVTTQRMLEQELEHAVSRERLLCQEMQHRIKNLFAVTSGLISIAEKEAREDQTANATAILRGKLNALARASDAVFAQGLPGWNGTGHVDVSMAVHAVLAPYGAACRAAGDLAAINRDMVTTLALYLHELATNSVKYGALSAAEGQIDVAWTLQENMVHLTWTEQGGPPLASAPGKAGFGSEMMDRVMRAAGGHTERDWLEQGLVVRLVLPAMAAHEKGTSESAW